VVDGDGGIDGRIDAPIRAPVAAAVAVDRTRLHVAYLWESQDTPRWSNVRLATHAAPEGVNALSISPTEIDFGEVKVGTDSATIPVTTTNHGTKPFGPISGGGGGTTTAEFTTVQDCIGATLGPGGGSCHWWYTFSPSAPGVFNDSSTFWIGEGGSITHGKGFTVALTGTGVP
jgi:hypothetical protein